EDVPSQHVKTQFVPTGPASLELLEATSPESAIARFIERRGEGLHHITLRVDDIGAALRQLRDRRVRLIDEQPRPGAEGSIIAFIHPASAQGVLVELKQVAPAQLELLPTDTKQAAPRSGRAQLQLRPKTI